MDPAGIRIPRSFKLAYTEKIPYIINKAQSLGASDQEIQNRLNEKKVTSTEKYGNRDRVGMLISMAK